jgi:hypothetical protein
MSYLIERYFGTDIQLPPRLEGSGPIYTVCAVTLEAAEHPTSQHTQREVVLLFDLERKRFLNPEELFDCNPQVQNAYTGDGNLLSYLYEAFQELGHRFYEHLQVSAPDVPVPLMEQARQASSTIAPLEQRLSLQ